MRRALVGLCVLLALTVPVRAQLYSSYEAITVSTSALGFTASLINLGGGHQQANSATCTLETAAIRYTIDGTTPTSTVGMLWNAGETKAIVGNQFMNQFRAIRDGGTDGDLRCTYAQ